MELFQPGGLVQIALQKSNVFAVLLLCNTMRVRSNGMTDRLLLHSGRTTIMTPVSLPF